MNQTNISTEKIFPKHLHLRIVRSVWAIKYRFLIMAALALLVSGTIFTGYSAYIELTDMDSFSIISDLSVGFEPTLEFIGTFLQSIVELIPLQMTLVSLSLLLTSAYAVKKFFSSTMLFQANKGRIFARA